MFWNPNSYNLNTYTTQTIIVIVDIDYFNWKLTMLRDVISLIAACVIAI